jgi:hypothetical protein
LIGLYVIQKVIALVNMLTVAIARNPIGALLVALTVGISLLRQFGDQMETSATAMTSTGAVAVTVGDYLRALWDDIKALGAGIMEFLEGAWGALTNAFSDGVDGSGMELSLKNVLLFMASFVDAAISLFTGLKETVVALFKGIPLTIGEAFVSIAQGVVRVVQEMVNGLIRAYNYVDEKINGARYAKERTDARMAADREEREALLRSAGKINPASFGLGDSVSVGGNAAAAAGLRQVGIDTSRYPKSFGYYGQDQESATLTGADLVRFRVAQAGAGSPLKGDRAAIDRQRKALGLDPREYGPGGGVDELDLSFANPLEGSFNDMRVRIDEAWGKNFAKNVARDFVSEWVDGLDEAAKAKAIERVKNQAKAGTIDETPGTKGKPIVTKEQESARRRLLKELESVTAASNPMVDAQMKLAKAVDVTTRAWRANIITLDQADEIVSDTAKKTADAREPMLAWVREMERENDLLTMTNNERERANAIRAVENDLRQKGLDINEDTQRLVAREIDIQRGQQALNESQKKHQNQLQEALSRIRAPMDDYNRNLDLLRELQKGGAITAEEFEEALRGIQDALIATGKARPGIERTVNDGLREMLKTATDTAGAMKTAFVNAYSGIENALVDLVTKGKADWSAMVQSMLADLTRLMIRQAIVAGMSALGMKVPVFAGGGSFMVGGRGGTDSQLVAFRASPNERVTVSNPSQTLQNDRRARRGNGGEGIGGLRIINQWDPAQPIAAMDSREGERLIVNSVIRNADSIRSHVMRK